MGRKGGTEGGEKGKREEKERSRKERWRNVQEEKAFERVVMSIEPDTSGFPLLRLTF